MEYLQAFPNGPAERVLEDGATRESVARESREAALAFLAGVTAGWDKVALVVWLTGAYAHATRHTKHGERVIKLSALDEIAEVSIEMLLGRVRAQLLASLEAAAREFGVLDFVEETRRRGFVRTLQAADGTDVWVPTDAVGMRLRDRVSSLFAADCLNVPHMYANLLVVCPRCEAVLFDEVAKRNGDCGAHFVSGIISKDGDGSVYAKRNSGHRR